MPAQTVILFPSQHEIAVDSLIPAALKDQPLFIKALHRRATASEKQGTWSSLSIALEGSQ